MTGLSVSSPAILQLTAFLEAVALGVFLAFFHDLYRALRQFRRLSLVISVTLDCFFWMVAAAAAIFFLIYWRRGEIYIYIYIGLAGGFILYFYCLSKYLLILWSKTYRFLARLFRHRTGGENKRIV